MKPTGYILWEGPSLLDGSPIVAIATLTSRNAKTGDMVNTWILRADRHPTEAIRDGSDRAICGDCIHRMQPDGRRTCYVRPQGPGSVWTAYKAGRYPSAQNHKRTLARIGAGRAVRLGAYGDPGAVPTWVWTRLLADADTWTGYTHNGGPTGLCMVSVDSPEEASDAHEQGFRTYRVLGPGEEPGPNELMCPHYTHGVQCIDCGLCDGVRSAADRRKSIVAPAHGTSAAFVNPERRARLAVLTA